MPRKHFQDKLEELKQEIAAMGELSRQVLDHAVRGFMTSEKGLADTIEKEDDPIDDAFIDLQEKAIDLLALQSPLATDLRLVGSSLAILIDLERIGDYAKNIAEITQFLRESPSDEELETLKEMHKAVDKMIADSVDAFVSGNQDLAEKQEAVDEYVDDLLNTHFEKLIAKAPRDPARFHHLTTLLFAARYLERAGDHANNIAKRTVYVTTGERKYI